MIIDQAAASFGDIGATLAEVAELAKAPLILHIEQERRASTVTSASGHVSSRNIDIGRAAARETCMKAFLLFLILGGAALYTFLVVTHDSLQDGKTETTLAVQTQPNNPSPSR